MQIKAACAGLRVMEVPVRYRRRVAHSQNQRELEGQHVCVGKDSIDDCQIFASASFLLSNFCETGAP